MTAFAQRRLTSLSKINTKYTPAATSGYANARQKALTYINQFKISTEPIVFPWVLSNLDNPNAKQPKIEIAKNLLNRINKPIIILQKDTSLCGPCAFLFSLASKRPDIYVSYLINLLLYGEAKIGKELNIKTDHNLINYSSAITAGIHYLDWIGAASLRNQWSFFHYNNVNSQFSGITKSSDLREWLSLAGARNVIDKTSYCFSQKLDNLKEAEKLFISNNTVFLLIDSNLLEFPDSNWSIFPNHWVVLNSSLNLTNADKSLNLSLYSWGNRNLKCSTERFLSHYYGYISAQWQ